MLEEAPKIRQKSNLNNQISIFNDPNGFVLNIGISVIGICLLFVFWVLEFPFMT